jgi:hypothetical protein
MILEPGSPDEQVYSADLAMEAEQKHKWRWMCWLRGHVWDCAQELDTYVTCLRCGKTDDIFTR